MSLAMPAHYPDVLAEQRANIDSLVLRIRSPDDGKGAFVESSASAYRMIVVIGYLVERDASAFRTNLSKATALRTELFVRFDAGEAIPPSYVSMLAYKDLLTGLASRDLGAARALAVRMGGRVEIERKYDRAFEIAMGYGLKAILAGDDSAAVQRIDALEQACKHNDYVNFAGYVPVLRAIVARDSDAAERAFPALIDGHRRESKGKRMFAQSPDKYLCVWGIGLVNLARSRGMDIKFDDPLLPAELTS